MYRFAFLTALLLPALAAADDYAVEGPDLAGKAVIDTEAGTYTLNLVRFRERGGVDERVELEGRVFIQRDGLRLSYTEEGALEWNGITSWLRGDFMDRVVETHYASLAPTPERGFQGTVKDMELTFVPQDDLSDLSVLVVPGLSTNIWNQYNIPYLDENMDTLAARGLTARRLLINTEESVAVNAADIAEEIRVEVAAGRRVLLIAHSKGGADTITALSDPRNADLLPHVAGLIAIQPVYGGSPISDFVAAGTPLEDMLQEVCGGQVNDKLLGSLQGVVDLAFSKLLPLINKDDDTGSPDAVRDLRSASRAELLARHPYPVDQVPTVVVRGYMERFTRDNLVELLTPRLKPIGQSVAADGLRLPLVLFQKYTETKLGEKSDGMVNLKNQSIPGAVATVTLSDLDHFEPGIRGHSPHRPVDITHQGLDLILPHLKAKPVVGHPRRPMVNLRLGGDD